MKTTIGNLRALIRESLLLNEEKVVLDKSSGSERYRVLTLRGNKDRYDGRLAIVDANVNDSTSALKIITDAGVDDVRWHNDSLVVDTNKRTIDLDETEWLDYKDRRKGKTGKKTYVIPNASAQHSNVMTFKKTLKAIMQHDKRVDTSYLIKGNPKYDDMTIGDVLVKKDDVSSAVEGVLPIVMYHGTSEKRYEAIKTKGLSPGNSPIIYHDMVSGYSEHNVYLTTSVAVAENYATRAAIDDKSKAVVIKVVVRDQTKFVIDEDGANWMMVPSPGEPWSDTPKGEDVEIHFRHKLWREWPNARQILSMYQSKVFKTLRKHHTVAYKGRIPASDIELYASYKPASMSDSPETSEFNDARMRTFDTYKKHGKKASVATRPKATTVTNTTTFDGKSYKVYGKKGSSPVHTRVKGKPFGPVGGKTSFKNGDIGNVTFDGNRIKVSSSDGSNTQTWEEIE